MLEIEFIKNMSDEEILKLTEIFGQLARINHWKILRELLRKNELTQDELKVLLSCTNVSKDTKFLVKHNIIEEWRSTDIADNGRKKYRLSDRNTTNEFSDLTQKFSVEYCKLFDNLQ